MAKSSTLGLLLFIIRAVSGANSTSETAFETFKGLQGKWAIQSGGKTLPIQMSYEVGSNGSIVMEQFGRELSVVYRDGESLLMTHFCNAGNEPRLRLKKSGRPGLLEFEMFDIANVTSADAAHVQRIIYKIIGDKQIDLEIIWLRGRSQESEKYTLTRISITA